MHDQSTLLEGRVRRFVVDHLMPALHRGRAALDLTAWHVPDEPVPVSEALAADYEPIEVGARWGRPWSTTWLHVTGAVPAEWYVDGALPEGTRAELSVDLGFTGGPGFNAEALAWRPDGTTIKGVAPDNSWVPVEDPAAIDLYLEAAANPDVARGWGFRPTPLGDKATAGDEPLYQLRAVDVVLLDVAVQELLADVATLSGLMVTLDPADPRRSDILLALQRMVDAVDPADVAGTATAGREALAGVLASPAVPSAHRVAAVGHAHIDSAWLWPLRETVRKCARTFSNVADLADAHDDFVFACSSAQQLAWIERDYPALFERIRDLVRRGQFVPVGGMWVESDTNMPGGEAMARQFVAGKSFFLDRFGVETEEVWLPDSFGYSAALPQIVLASSSRWFLTQKISWNQTNTMPHHTFRWEGIDGSQVFTHFPPADTYNGTISGEELARASRQYREKGHGSISLLPFGHGDGGGGPTREMVARARRTASLEGSPKVELMSPRDFFTAAEAEYPQPPVWSGEMYLELHRGTYTSQLRTKQGNRRNEHLLREAELWAATAASRTSFEYPYAELEELWQMLLLLQFHDILPGSSIAWVHSDAERNHAAITERAQAVTDAALAALVGEGDQVLLANAAPHPRDGVPALGVGPVVVSGSASLEQDGDGWTLRNERLTVRVDADGLVTSMVDAATGREAIAPGTRGNLLQLHRDEPVAWDAWDIDEYYRRTVRDLTEAESVEPVEAGEAACLQVTRRFGESTVVQRLVLAPGAESLRVEHDLDWHERQKLLKLAWGFDVHADRAASETQFGHVLRPTHTNTSWEAARFETCAHRWVHVGEPDYGVAVSNDSTYGHDIRRHARPDGGTTTTVRLSLVRAPLFPDPEADQGRHSLAVTVRPGALVAHAVEEGYRTNLAPRQVTGSGPVEPLVTVSDPAIVVEAVKLAADRSGDVVVRLYESRGARARGTVAVAGATSVQAVDLLERPGTPGVRPCGDLSGATAQLELRPFQLVTLRFSR
ncbi:alpha-mannosidase [Auraticoccus sp. F435]|uniref:Alpha-mannosidase n=1 Tax=Auraticoccus cholistanensis TaxID=2656650 RepID=A0A6A9UXY5_9ACTN|nr:glycoside hydrolase family 38 C-terminal domain-containing protein [Auraticoccus cholistanensis]MVA76514.1 alpha-mannosidase [Auraticoccus cholistanensis]